MRVTAALAAAAVLWAQYPALLRPDLTVAVAGHPSVLAAVLGALAVGALLLGPAVVSRAPTGHSERWTAFSTCCATTPASADGW